MAPPGVRTTQRRRARARGEVNEVIAQLEQLSSLDGRRADVIKGKRECFQKLLRHMTAGIDMSEAFIPATKCAALSKTDLPLKKMLYWYLRSAARQNAEVALLVVQALTSDARDVDPAIRGLALRSICSLRVPSLMDTVFVEVENGLKDPHPYVREVAVIGVLKCHDQDSVGVEQHGLLDAIHSMLLNETEPQVIANCLFVLKSVGLIRRNSLPRSLVISLLNNIRAFSDWAHCLVLDILLQYYRPQSQDERFDMLEILDFGLNHTNSAVVLYTAKLFLHYTDGYPEQYDQVLLSILPPLRTLLLGREPEVVYATLSNIVALAERHTGSFKELVEDIFYRPEDPSYLKLLKLQALVAFAEVSNAFDVAEETSQYARDQEDDVARASIRAIARIALKIPEVEGILDRLLLFLTHPRIAVAGEAVAVMVDVLRRFPDAAPACVNAIVEVNKSTFTDDIRAKSAYIWVIGEYGDTIQEAPYILESMNESFVEEDPQVKLALLASTARLFFKRPPECYETLKNVLASGVKDESTLVRDRANFYYKLFCLDPNTAREVIGAPYPPLARLEESQPIEIQDRIFDEWNTLSTIYKAPASMFIDDTNNSAEGLGDAETFGAGYGDATTELVVDEGNSKASVPSAPLLLDMDEQNQSVDASDPDISHPTESLENIPIASQGHQPASVMDLLADLSVSQEDQIPPKTEEVVKLDPFLSELNLISTPANVNYSIEKSVEEISIGNEGGGLDTSMPAIPGFVTGNPTNLKEIASTSQDSVPLKIDLDVLDIAGNQVAGNNENGEALQDFGFGLDALESLTSSTHHASSGVIEPMKNFDDKDYSLHNLGQSSSPHNEAVGLDDFLGGFYNDSNSNQLADKTTEMEEHSLSTDEVILERNPHVSQQEYQDEWLASDCYCLEFDQQLTDANEGIRTIQSQKYEYFKSYLAQANLAIFATPKEDSPLPLRFLLHARRENRKYNTSGRVLTQLSVHASGVIKCITRTKDLAAGKYVQELLKTLLLTL